MAKAYQFCIRMTPVISLISALACVIALVAPVRAVEPPDAEQYKLLLESGKLKERIQFARQFENYKVDPFLLKRAIIRMQRVYLKQLGKSADELDMTAPLPTPPPGWRGMPTTGNVKILTILIEFQDYTHTNSRLVIHNGLFGIGNPLAKPYESLAAYYDRSSYSQLNLSGGTTLGWYQTAYDRSAVTDRETLIKEVLDHYNAQGHDFSQYDNDGNGVIDYLVIIWAGPDTGWGTFWWGYLTSFSDPGYTLDGKRLGRYSWQWESRPEGRLFSPLVVIHETGHALGVPDFYDYDDAVGPKGGVGRRDIMDGNMGDHNCFSKWMLDWLVPTPVAGGSQTIALNGSGSSQDCVVIWPGVTTNDLFSEYFVAQNRHRVGNDDASGMCDGMLIWHVDAALEASGNYFLYDNSFTQHKLLRLMEADGLEEIETLGYSSDCEDYYTAGNTLGPCTTPSSKAYDGTDTEVEIMNISAPGAQMSATYQIGVTHEPDYAPAGLILSDNSVDPGDSVQVSFKVKNQGGTPSACINLAILLSTDNTITTSDEVLINWALPGCNLSSCAESSQIQTVTIPNDTSPGTYYIGVYADIDGYQAESEEGNNTLSKQIDVKSNGGWTTMFSALSLNKVEVATFRIYRDEYLNSREKGKLYTTMLYRSSEAALEVLNENPDLLARAREILNENKNQLDLVMAGETGTIENADDLIAFLEDFSDRSPALLSALSTIVKRDIVDHRAAGRPWLGFLFIRDSNEVPAEVKTDLNAMEH